MWFFLENCQLVAMETDFKFEKHTNFKSLRLRSRLRYQSSSFFILFLNSYLNFLQTTFLISSSVKKLFSIKIFFFIFCYFLTKFWNFLPYKMKMKKDNNNLVCKYFDNIVVQKHTKFQADISDSFWALALGIYTREKWYFEKIAIFCDI